METVLRMKGENKPISPSHPKKTRKLGGFFAAILAVCYEFLSWLDSLRGGKQKNQQKMERTVQNDAKNEKRKRSA